MKIYELEKTAQDDILYEYKLVDEKQDDYFFHPYLGVPRRVKEEWPKIELKKVDGRIPGDYLFVSGIPGLILNEKALNVLLEYFENCEILDIYIDGVKCYYINVLDTSNCYDKDSGKYRLYEEYGAVIVSKYALLAGDIKEKHIFRVSLENIDYRAKPKMNIFVSEKFKQTVRDAGLTGFKFVEVPVR